MKAWSAVTELSMSAILFLVVGTCVFVPAAVGTDPAPPFGGFEVVLGVAICIAILAQLGWVVRSLRRAEPAPASIEVGSAWRTLWMRVVPNAGTSAALAIFMAVLSGPTKVFGGMYLLAGVGWGRVHRRRRALRDRPRHTCGSHLAALLPRPLASGGWIPPPLLTRSRVSTT
jgi:hypothetical protein